MKSIVFWPWVVLLAPPLAYAASTPGTVSMPTVMLGDSCEHVANLEIAAGARPKYDVQRMLQNKFLLFDVSGPGRSRETLYRCSDENAVRSYSETISTQSARVARDVYENAKEQLRSLLGAPQVDSEADSLPRRIALWRAFGRAFATYESANWRGAHEHTSVTLERARDASDWQVITLHAAWAATARSALTASYLTAAGATAALWSATIVGALCLTALRRFRVLLTVATPLALSLELYWSAPIAGSTLNDAIAPFAAGDAVLMISFVTGVVAAGLIAWATRRYRPAAAAAARGGGSGRPAVLSGLALLGGCFLCTWWLFRPSHDPASLLGGAGLFLIAPLSLLLATGLTLTGTVRLLSQRPPIGQPVATPALAVCGVLGAVTALTLCLNLVGQVALRL